VLLRLVADFRRAMDLSLVLDEEGIGHQLRSMGPEQWALFVEDADAERAQAALLAFEGENPPQPTAPEALAWDAGMVAGGVFALALLALQPWMDREWLARGSAEAALIVGGEWWRTITALTLHADEAHAIGNAALGGLLLALLARKKGAGIASLLLLLSGALGTLCAAELLRRNFTSIGASTAVFGALGALCALQAADPRERRRAWIPIGAGLALLGFLGTSQRADLAGHLCGFGAGLLLGAVTSRLPSPRSLLAQGALAAVAIAAPVLAWWRALHGAW